MLMIDRIILLVVVRVLGEVVFWADKGIVERGFAVPTEDIGITVSFFVSFLQAS